MRLLALLGIAFLLGSVLLSLGAEASVPSEGTLVDIYCPVGEPCPASDFDDYTVTGFKQTEPHVIFEYWPGGAPFGPQHSAFVNGVGEWSSAGANVTTAETLLGEPPAGSSCGGQSIPGLENLPQTHDGLNTILWAPLSDGTIGLACWWFATNECDIVLDSTWAGAANEEATRTVVLHEVGHCLGLGHTTVSGAVMYPTYSQPRHLHADDRAGLIAIYGPAGGGGTLTPPPSPTPWATITPTPLTPTPSHTPTPTITPNPPTATPTPIWKRCGWKAVNVQWTCAFVPGLSRD